MAQQPDVKLLSTLVQHYKEMYTGNKKALHYAELCLQRVVSERDDLQKQLDAKTKEVSDLKAELEKRQDNIVVEEQ